MREQSHLSRRGNALHAGLFGHAGMLHRTKYSRFRNDSVTSLEEGMQGTTTLAVNPKESPCPASSLPVCPGTGAPCRPNRLAVSSPGESSSTLCTFIPKMASIKISNPASLLGLKGLTQATKEGPRGKLSGDCGPAETEPQPHLAGYLPPSSHLRQELDSDKLASRTEGLSTSLKSIRRMECYTPDVLESGMTYHIKYMGCLEVIQSMRMLDFETRTQVTREAISRLCEYVPGTKTAPKRRKPPSKGLSTILGKSNLQFSGMNIKLNISTDSLSLTTLDSQQTIAHHHMQSISFASGGDPDTTDYVAYVAKDPVNQRAVHILECPDGLAQEVINTIGQAFELRFRQFLRNPSSLIATKQRAAEADASGGWGHENAEIREYYNEIPGKEPPPGGLLDMRVKLEALQRPPGGQAEEDEHRGTGCPQHLNVYENCSLAQKQLFPSADFEKGMVPLFLMDSREAEYSALGEGNPLSGVLQDIQDMLQHEAWYHGKMSRLEAESLLMDSGDFLVRESSSAPGQYVLSGLQGSTVKHLLLVDPEGMVRTKDHIFDSVGHLIRYHMDNQRPIVSCGSELCLKQPVIQKQ